MRYLIAIVLALFSSLCHAQTWEDRQHFSNDQASRQLRIISSTDTAFLTPVIEGFLSQNPDISIEYLVTSTTNLDRTLRAAPHNFDIAISSAMDLQLKLVNDGFAAEISDTTLPNWATWRHRLFAFTAEPAAIVLNREVFQNYSLPQNRQDLIKVLRDHPEMFSKKIGTYDVRESGLGYLFATQDARASETYWRLMEVMGGLGTKLYCCSSNMLDDIAAGKLAVAYNVLGSYAAARSDIADKIEVVLPSDFPTTMMRTVLLSNHAKNSKDGTAFIHHLINSRSDLGAGLTAIDSIPPAAAISLEPALMTYLDKLKRQTFINEWSNAIIQ